jgi:hypothetical protein
MSLEDGIYTFKVRAIDQAENAQVGSAQFSWEVDNSLAEPPPMGPPPPTSTPTLAAPQVLPPALVPATPNTLIVGKPGARTHDRTPTFRFRASEKGAAFQCKLDSGPFKPCRSPYTTKRLPLGPHTLKVRATLGGTRDPSAAAWSFTIVASR